MEQFKNSIMTLGEKIRILRDNKGLTQREVGYIIGLDGTYISQIELNKKSLKRSHLKMLADFFEIRENELQTLWLSDKVFKIVEKEENAKESINIVLKKLKEIN